MTEASKKNDAVELRIRSFESKILFFNGMYKLPVAPYPSLTHLGEPPVLRLEKFRTTLLKEVDELHDIFALLQTEAPPEEILTAIADWLTDIQIYCASEMAKFGLPIAESQRIVMQSNFSKLQADGSVKYDAHGKVEKGPGYWKPEPLLQDMIEAAIAEAKHKPSQTG